MAAADDSIAKDALPLFLSFPHPISRPVLLWPTCGFRVSQSLQTLLSCSFCSWRSCVRASATVPPMIATRRGLGWSGVEAARAESGANEEKRREEKRREEQTDDRERAPWIARCDSWPTQGLGSGAARFRRRRTKNPPCSGTSHLLTRARARSIDRSPCGRNRRVARLKQGSQ